jgi:hypothetical protein
LVTSYLMKSRVSGVWRVWLLALIFLLCNFALVRLTTWVANSSATHGQNFGLLCKLCNALTPNVWHPNSQNSAHLMREMILWATKHACSVLWKYVDACNLNPLSGESSPFC